jgi:hypothetical protein
MRKARFILIFLLYSQLSGATSLDKIERLAGIVTNKYQIRNDILTYIDETAPTFSRSWHALIRIAHIQQFLYYRAKSEEEANNAVEDSSVAIKCLSKEYKDNEDYEIFKHIESMMADTEERRKHIFEVSNRFFGTRGWKHAKISDKELDSKCASGDYA